MIQKGCLVIGAEPAADKPGAACSLIGWPPMLWTLRIGLIIVLAVALYIFLLSVLRYFRPANAKLLFRAGLPRVKEVGGKVAGMEATAVLADSNTALEQFATLDARLSAVESQMDRLMLSTKGADPGGKAG